MMAREILFKTAAIEGRPLDQGTETEPKCIQQRQLGVYS